MKDTTIKRTICFECHSRCGVLIGVQGGKLSDIKGDKDHPFSKGFTCPKGRAVKETVYHPERLTKPIKRLGGKGKGKWKEISWPEALSEMAHHLLKIRETYGAEAVVFGQGTTRGLPPYINRLLRLFGSPNFMGTQNLSGHPVVAGSVHTCGFSFMGSPDYKNSQCLLLWGHNPQASFPGLYMNDINEAVKRRAKLIVVDPREIPLATRADLWLRVRPGTDAALALGMINCIIEKELFDKNFVENWTIGFEELKDHSKTFTLDRVAEITWVPAELIEKAAETFATSKPACIGPGMAGVCQNTNSFQLNRAITILSSITGNLDISQGGMYIIHRP